MFESLRMNNWCLKPMEFDLNIGMDDSESSNQFATNY